MIINLIDKYLFHKIERNIQLSYMNYNKPKIVSVTNASIGG